MEIGLFHPFDTVGKRLMSHQENVFHKQRSFKQTCSILNQVAFRDAADLPLAKKWGSLYMGVQAAMTYKVAQRAIRFGGQPILAEYIHEHYHSVFKNAVGEKMSKPMLHAATGAFMGFVEISIVPFDVLKIKMQTNPEALKGRGMLGVIRNEGFRLWQGSFWTVARNAPGSFALFGGAAMAKEHILHLDDYNKATLWQQFVASIVGSTACIVIANPLDVIKTRVQNRSFDRPESGIKIIKEMVKKEGMGAFYKGFGPKMTVVGPKLMFAYTSSQYLMSMIDEHVNKGKGKGSGSDSGNNHVSSKERINTHNRPLEKETDHNDIDNNNNEGDDNNDNVQCNTAQNHHIHSASNAPHNPNPQQDRQLAHMQCISTHSDLSARPHRHDANPSHRRSFQQLFHSAIEQVSSSSSSLLSLSMSLCTPTPYIPVCNAMI